MSFDVFFVALEPPKPTAELHAQVKEAVSSVGGRLVQREIKGHGSEDIEVEGGATFEWYGPNPSRHGSVHEGGAMAALRGLSLPICQCLYAIAAKTDWVIVAAMEDSRTVRVKGTRELPLYEGMPQLMLVEGAEELCAVLGGSHAAWSAYRDQVSGHRK